MKITILGCGSSSGVPHIGGTVPNDAKNIRSRASIHIQGKTTGLLIDTSPDLRQQALVNKIVQVDAVLYTHTHADHLHGIDDIKGFNYLRQDVIDVYGDALTIKEITERFAYCFRAPKPEYGWYRPALRAHNISFGQEFTIGEFKIMPFLQHHGSVHSVGYRIGNFVYSTDVKAFPPESHQYLKDIDIWVVDVLRREVAPTHSHLEQTLGWIEEFKPKRAYLTHMNSQMDYNQLCAELPPYIRPCYDGLVLEV